MIRLWILCLLVAVTALRGEGGGSDIGSGGDAVKCTSQPNSPIYALDYLMTSSGNNADIAATASWEASRDRLLRLLGTRYPELARSFAKFVKFMDNRTPSIDYRLERIWEGSDNGLLYLNDQKLTRALSADCVKPNKLGEVPIIQAVIRQQKPNSRIIYYEYDKAYYEGMRNRTPLQFSFLMVHEWLWDLTQDVQIIRRTNRFLHSRTWESWGSDDFRVALEHIGLSLRQTDFKRVCERTPAVARAIEESQGMDCADISSENFNMHRLSTLSLEEKDIAELENGDFSGLYRLQTVHLQGNHLKYLPENLFAGLFALKTVTLQDNSLSEIPPRLFSDSPHLNVLNLSRNPISRLPEGLFAHLAQMGEEDDLNLFLAHLPLTSLPTDFFARQRHFGVLDLRGTKLSPQAKADLQKRAGAAIWNLRLDR